MELGDLEVAILRILSATDEARPKEIHRHLQDTHPVAYTTVTNTLYRLVEKNLVTVRRVGPRRSYYALSEAIDSEARKGGGLLGRLLEAFGNDAISRLVSEDSKTVRSRRRKGGD